MTTAVFFIVLAVVVVACAVLVAQAQIQAADQRERYEAALEFERGRSADLMDRLQAGSLEQYHAMQAVANGITEDPAPTGRWVHDQTGLISAFVPDGE